MVEDPRKVIIWVMMIYDQSMVQDIAVSLQADIRRNWVRFRESEYPNLKERLYPYQVKCKHHE